MKINFAVVQPLLQVQVVTNGIKSTKLCASLCGSRNFGNNKRACNAFSFDENRNLCVSGFVPIMEALEVISACDAGLGEPNETLFLDRAIWEMGSEVYQL